jgi:hypothetical protein
LSRSTAISAKRISSGWASTARLGLREIRFAETEPRPQAET